MNNRRIHLVANSHIDPVWLWDKYEGMDEVINTFKSACDRLDEYPELKFSASSICFYEWVENFAPELFKRIQQHVKSGRWEITGGWWVETDCNLPTAESFYRSAEISLRYVRDRFGVAVPVGYSPDSFGHPATLPKILSETGFKYYIFCRPDRNENPNLPEGVFYWEYEGHRVLCYRVPHHYTQGAVPTDSRVEHALSDEKFAENGIGCYMFGVGNHGGGPAKQEIEYLSARRETLDSHQLIFSTCLEFFQEAEKYPDIPVVTGDLHIHAVGCYSVNRNIKEGIRKSENILSYAKRSLKMSGQDDDGCLDGLWKTTIFNQFHDIMPGSCAPEAAAHAVEELGGVCTSALDISYGALKRLSLSIPVKSPHGEFRIFNTLPYSVTGPFEIENWPYFRKGSKFIDGSGEHIPVQAVTPSVMCQNNRWMFIDTIPANGMKSYNFTEETYPECEEPHNYTFSPGNTIEMNGFQVEAPGIIRHDGISLFKSPITLGVVPDQSDTWSHGLHGFGPAEGYFKQIESGINTGPLVSTLISRQQYGSSTAELIFKAYHSLPFVDLDVNICWMEHSSILKMELGMPEDITSILAQGPGGVIDKSKPHTEEPMHGWLSTGNLNVIQSGAFAFDWSDDKLRITLVRSSFYGYVVGWPIDKLGPVQPTDIGEHRFWFRFIPGMLTANEKDEYSSAFNEPFSVMRENASSMKP